MTLPHSPSMGTMPMTRLGAWCVCIYAASGLLEPPPTLRLLSSVTSSVRRSQHGPYPVLNSEVRKLQVRHRFPPRDSRGTVMIALAPSDAAENGGKIPWMERLKRLPASVFQRFTLALVALRRLLAFKKSRDSLTPGRSKPGGGGFLARFTQNQKRFVFFLVVASFLWLDVAHLKAGSSRLPPPRELAYSEFIKQVGQAPLDHLICFVTRWYFGKF